MKKIKPLLWAGSLLAAGLMAPGGHAQTYTFSTVAGGSAGSLDGLNSAAQFFTPTGAAVDAAGNIYVADQGNDAVRRITPSGTNWSVSTIAGGTRGSGDGMNFQAQFYGPSSIAVDSMTNLYVADQLNYTVRKISPQGTNWVVSTIAGQAGVHGARDGTNTGAQFYNPVGIAVDQSGNIFVADEFNNAIRKISPQGTNWVVSTVAGGSAGSADGTNTAAQFYYPAGVAVDAGGRVFVADQINNEIRLVTPQSTNWAVTTIAGNLIGGASNGLGTNALFLAPVGIALDAATNVYVAEEINNDLRMLSPSGTNWQVSTIGGGARGTTNGIGTNAQFYFPFGVATDGYGDIYVADSGNNEIRLGVSSSGSAQAGGVEVTITPSNAVTAGAEWQLDGGAFQVSGATVNDVGLGQHTVTFSNVSGFTTPAYQIVTVTAHQTNSVTGNYPTAISNAGSLEVLISPVGASAARWQVDSGALQTNGAIVAGLSIGSHTLSFGSLAGWTAPSNQMVEITNSQTTLGLGTYSLLAGSLQVTILPGAAVTAGAKWQIDGGPWHGSGEIVSNVAAGNHTIDVNAITGLPVPPDQIVNVSNNVTTDATITYGNGSNYTVTVTAVPSADGTVTGSGSYTDATFDTITATPNSGFEFVGWAGGATGTNASESVPVTTNLNISAYFAPTGSTVLFIVTNGEGRITPANLNGTTLKAGRKYSLTATPMSGNVFVDWTGSQETNRDIITFEAESSLVLQANVIPSPYPPFKGTYNGLFVSSGGVTEQTAGILRTFTVAPGGGYSGTLVVNGAGHAFSGKFNVAVQATNRIPRAAAQGGPLAVALVLVNTTNAGPQVVGTVSGVTNGVPWVADLVADLAVKGHGSTNYTMLLPPDTNNAPPESSPGGDGYASIVDNGGAAAITGALADGVSFSQMAPVAQTGYVPVFANLYAGHGLLLGWINLDLTNTAGVSLTWIHPATRAGLYQSGFTNILLTNEILLSPWTNRSDNIVLLTNLTFGDAITNTNSTGIPIAVSTNGKITGDSITGSINVHNGVFTVTSGSGPGRMVGRGAILLNATNGGGYWLTKTNAQAVQLNP